jgi:hypothetical protein
MLSVLSFATPSELGVDVPGRTTPSGAVSESGSGSKKPGIDGRQFFFGKGIIFCTLVQILWIIIASG